MQWVCRRCFPSPFFPPARHCSVFFRAFHKHFLIRISIINSDRHDSKDSPKDTSKAKQNVSKLLLLSMFAIAARYLDDIDAVVNNEKENGTIYLADAQKILSKCRNRSRLCRPLFSCSRTTQTKFTGTVERPPFSPSYCLESGNLELVCFSC